MFGGLTIKKGEVVPEYHKDLRQLDTETMTWSKPLQTAADAYPSARYAHTLSQLGPHLVRKRRGGRGEGAAEREGLVLVLRARSK